MSGTSVVEGFECWASRGRSPGFKSLSCQTSKCDRALNPPVILGYCWLVQCLTAGRVLCMHVVQYQHKILNQTKIVKVSIGILSVRVVGLACGWKTHPNFTKLQIFSRDPQLYKRVCLSVGWSVGLLVRWSISW